ncbi:hypothetical protein GCM10023206_06790 [Acinetobacter puyangensis]|uniref:Uncharacterized protein n=1 Tax=Acinetobacter puyangensis TaxID=1096779 RepID=A0A240E6L4_9GAMM|nr:hypothetical protein [Acinetobacter puyangensis]SNX44242.1 hypothetical protein SAMN05421731_102403 [Acinetobacter puyangensis]
MASNQGTLETIVVTATDENPGPWVGRTAKDAYALYNAIYALGTISTAHFGVEFSPLFNDGKIANLDLALFDNSTYKIPFLAQNVEASLIDADTDSIKVGAFNLNHITGNASNEVQISFIETKNGDISESFRLIKNCTFNDDGTQFPPKDYLMRVQIYSFDRNDYNFRAIEQAYIVALQAASVPFDATNLNGVLVVPVTFTKMFPMLVNL